MISCGLRTGNEIDKRLYSIWRKMHYRCESPTHRSYDRYGGRGIKVCDEWNSLIVFGKWALENGYSKELTLVRINNDGDYEPSNCMWATKETQANNKSLGEHIVINGEIKSFSVRFRSTWEYRINHISEDGKRKPITKAGFKTKEDCINSAKLYFESNNC